MSKLETIQIDATPENIAEMMKGGAFHSWQDGKWRFDVFGWSDRTVYTDRDPTEGFTHRAEFPNGYAAAAYPPLGLFAQIFFDGTRGIERFDKTLHPVVWQMYGARNEGERQMREWLRDVLKG